MRYKDPKEGSNAGHMSKGVHLLALRVCKIRRYYVVISVNFRWYSNKYQPKRTGNFSAMSLIKLMTPSDNASGFPLLF